MRDIKTTKQFVDDDRFEGRFCFHCVLQAYDKVDLIVNGEVVASHNQPARKGETQIVVGIKKDDDYTEVVV